MSGRGRPGPGETHLERQAEMLGLTLAQLLLLRAVARKTIVRPPSRVMLVMDVLTEWRLVELRAWGRYVLLPAGHAAIHRPVEDPPVWLTDGGGLRFTTRPDGRHVVDDGVPDRERGYSTARAYETEVGSLEAQGLSTNPGRRSRTSGSVERQDPARLHWSWAHDAEQRRKNAQNPHEIASQLRRLGATEGP